jgi:hypothetical protein
MKQAVMSMLALVGALALAGGAFYLWSNRPGRTAVSVNGRVLTARELEQRTQTLLYDAKRVENILIPEKEMDEALRYYRRRAAKMWIIKEVLLAAAVESGVKASAEDEKESLSKVARQLKSRNLTPEQFFKEGPIPEATKRSDFKETVLIGKYTKREIEDKISLSIARLLEEDRTLKYHNSAATKQLILSGLGDMHLEVVSSKLESRFGTSIEMKKPNTPIERSANQRKKFFGSGSIFQDANVPANTMIAESIIINTEIPSTPRANLMLSGVYQSHDAI